MRKMIAVPVFAALAAWSATASSASYFDGNTALLCSVHQLFECNPPSGCNAVTPEQIQERADKALEIHWSDDPRLRYAVTLPADT